MQGKEPMEMVEWLAAIGPMGRVFEDERELFVSEGLVFVDANGRSMGDFVDEPGALLPRAGAHLAAAIADPHEGRPHAPGRIRVASRDLAEAFRVARPDIEIVVAPTPELDEVMRYMRVVLQEDHADEMSHLWSGRGADAVAAFYRAFAALRRAAPWEHIPGGNPVFVTLEALGLDRRPLLVVEHRSGSKVFALFDTLDDFYRYVAERPSPRAVEAFDDPSTTPPHLLLSFTGPDLAGITRQREVTAHGWEIADVYDAYPFVEALNEGREARPLTPDEHTIAEAIALALAQVVVGSSVELRAAWADGAPFGMRVRVAPHGRGEMNVTMWTRREAEGWRAGGSFGPLAGLRALTANDNHVPERRLRLTPRPSTPGPRGGGPVRPARKRSSPKKKKP